MKSLTKRILTAIVRKKQPIVYPDLSRLTPVSKFFGMERGIPIDRYYIEKFLEKNKSYLRGSVLEVADSHYSRTFGNDDITSFEILSPSANNSKATIIGDLTDIDTLPENFIDCFICTQTFNFIFEVQKAVMGAHRLLKPGGVLLATVAGISQISRYDMERWGDYWRFTTASINNLFSPVFGDRIELQTYGNVSTAAAFLQGLAIEDFPDQSILQENDPDYQLIITIIAHKERL